ncbi:uncharacterized protein FHU37_001490 [Allostreptomyces psammosilenae]|uniref:DUF418 domain-containing protein n=1 Tax=Allostreptomyces psammosilenae TaxID=1892865 RepID=A0A852ZSR3_9ACTN|nr:DUF418 domain-containing protein [Allostreptomyces psammosilenae]NYI04547.1 uncharacterized protein [Allostreptomyces psammosilenae]
MPSSTPVTGPAGTTGRLPLLDVLRGAAILGTLMTNVWIFSSPGSEWGILTGATPGSSLRELLSDPAPALAAESLFRFLADGKFLSMLTILFGVGLAIQFASAARRGQPWPGRYRRRALFLFAEGTAHFLLVFAWDVLMGYAVTALLVAGLLTRSERFRRAVMWCAAGLHVAGMALLTAGLVAADSATGEVDAEVVALYADGGYLDQVAFRLDNAVLLRLEPVLSFGLLLFLFLLGVRLFRAGAFQPDAAGRRLRVRMLRWGLGLGLPLNAATALGGMDFFLLSRYVAAPLVAIGYIGLIGVLLDRTRRPGRLVAALTSVGRTALSSYVAQNALCVLACYGIGLGLATRFEDSGPWWVMGLWATVCLLLVVGSTLWLRRFSHGPLEALQRWALNR